MVRPSFVSWEVAGERPTRRAGQHLLCLTGSGWEKGHLDTNINGRGNDYDNKVIADGFATASDFHTNIEAEEQT